MEGDGGDDHDASTPAAVEDEEEGRAKCLSKPCCILRALAGCRLTAGSGAYAAVSTAVANASPCSSAEGCTWGLGGLGGL